MSYAQRVQTVTQAVASTESTTTAYTAFSIPVHYDSMLIIASLVGVTGGTLDIYIQDSFDGGTTWCDCAHFTQVTAAGAVKEAATLTTKTDMTTIGVGSLATPGVALAAAKMRPAPWGEKLRLVSVTGAGTSGAAATQTIIFVPTDYSD